MGVVDDDAHCLKHPALGGEVLLGYRGIARARPVPRPGRDRRR